MGNRLLLSIIAFNSINRIVNRCKFTNISANGFVRTRLLKETGGKKSFLLLSVDRCKTKPVSNGSFLLGSNRYVYSPFIIVRPTKSVDSRDQRWPLRNHSTPGPWLVLGAGDLFIAVTDPAESLNARFINEKKKTATSNNETIIAQMYRH